MRRLLLILGIVVAMLTSPLLAQRHGGRSGSFSRSSFAPHGTSFAGRGFGSSHFGPRFGGGFGPHYGHGFHGGFPHGYHSRSNWGFYGAFAYPYYGFYASYGYPYNGFYAGYGYPAYAYSYPAYSYPVVQDSAPRSGSDLDYSYQQKRNMEELDRLEDRIRKLEDQRASVSTPRPPQYQAQANPTSPVVLIFRDKHSRQAENYAIVGQTIWLFNEQRATKIPLSQIDLAATQKANEERGVEFQVPTSR